ncbi:MAG TPA: hypothetical protein VN628_14240 [Vicinamibacterales bacterium]|nr:hypothetical protein [Vicinamibacterales bacterium]
MRSWIALVILALAAPAHAQEHDHAKMLRDMQAAAGWQVMDDGDVFVMFNHQSSPRGGDEVVAPNWWMLMASRKTAHGTITLNGMWSLDPATVGGDGYRELFQTGEVYQGQPLIDRQHPHDLFMQLSASWRIPLSASTSVTFSGGPVAAPALGPIAFMHRASAFDNPMAPLTHHMFDSTHVSFGVATAALEHGPWTIEGSVFNGREPDEHRWDFDFGRMDSVSGRLWFKPNAQWAFQVSTGHLVHPEQFEPGDAQRTTASASWTRVSGQSIDAVTAGFGSNDGPEQDFVRSGAFVEGAHHVGANTVYGRVEILKIDPHIAGVAGAAFTIGGVRDVVSRHGFEGGVGVALTLNATRALLDPFYGSHPFGAQVFFRLRRAEHMMNMP